MVPSRASRITRRAGNKRGEKRRKADLPGKSFCSRGTSPRRQEGGRGGLIERSKGGGGTKWSTIIRSAGENADVPFLIYPRALMSANLRQLNFLADHSILWKKTVFAERCSFSPSKGSFFIRGEKGVLRKVDFRSNTMRNLSWSRSNLSNYVSIRLKKNKFYVSIRVLRNSCFKRRIFESNFEISRYL